MDRNPLIVPPAQAPWPTDGKLVDTANINTVYYLNPNVNMPYVQQWNLGLGFQFGKDYGLELNYVASKGTHLFGPTSQYNVIDPARYREQFVAGLNMTERVPNPAGLQDANGNIITVARQDLLRGIPTMGSIGNPLGQGYNSNYNALQVNLRKRFAHGLQYQINYTWMKSIDDSSCDGQFCNDNIQNWGTGAPQLLSGPRQNERSVSVFSLPHVFRFNYNWDLPFGKGKAFGANMPSWLNFVAGNWKTSGTGGLQSGSPLQAALGNNAGFPEDVGRIRPNINPGVAAILSGWRNNLNNPVTQRTPYVNTLALFSAPDRLTTGNAPRVFDHIRMPTTGSYNMSVMKEFPVKDQIRFAFRAELFGALNHPFPGTNGNNFTVYQNLNYQASATPAVAAANINPAYADIGANIGGRRTIQLGLKLYF